MKRYIWQGLGGWGMELGYNHPPYVDALINLEALRNPYYWDFIEASPNRQDQSLSTFPVPLWRMESRAENSNS